MTALFNYFFVKIIVIASYANVLNGCVGAGCKEGEVTHKPVLENIITVNNNIKLKKVLQGLKEKEALNREGM